MAAVIKGILELLFGLLLSLVLPDQHHCIHNFGWAISPSAGSAEPLQGQHTCLHFGERTSKERVRAFSPGKPWILGGPCHGCPMPWMPWHGQGCWDFGHLPNPEKLAHTHTKPRVMDMKAATEAMAIWRHHLADMGWQDPKGEVPFQYEKNLVSLFLACSANTSHGYQKK